MIGVTFSKPLYEKKNSGNSQISLADLGKFVTLKIYNTENKEVLYYKKAQKIDKRANSDEYYSFTVDLEGE